MALIMLKKYGCRTLNFNVGTFLFYPTRMLISFSSYVLTKIFLTCWKLPENRPFSVCEVVELKYRIKLISSVVHNGVNQKGHFLPIPSDQEGWCPRSYHIVACICNQLHVIKVFSFFHLPLLRCWTPKESIEFSSAEHNVYIVLVFLAEASCLWSGPCTLLTQALNYLPD